MSEKVKHTPGPWKVVADTAYISNDIVTEKHGVEYEVATVWWDGNREEIAANSNLIAFAPEMYEALKEIYIEAQDMNVGAIEQIAANIIKKTEGRS